MEREVTYSLQLWPMDPLETDVRVLAVEADMRYVLEVSPGYVLRAD